MPLAEETETPDYRGLYYRWEQEQWEAGAIDLVEDRRQWDNEIAPEVRRSILRALAHSYVGQDQATNLVAFIDAAPTEEQQVFLTTQLADEARSAVFFDRFRSEVLTQEVLPPPSDAYRTLVLESLPVTAEKISGDHGDMDALVEGVALCHLTIAGAVLLPGHHSLLTLLQEQDVLPGLRRGLTAMTRDGSRHADFGMRFMTDMIAADRRYVGVIHDALRAIVPTGLEMTELAALSRRVKLLGVELEL